MRAVDPECLRKQLRVADRGCECVTEVVRKLLVEVGIDLRDAP